MLKEYSKKRLAITYSRGKETVTGEFDTKKQAKESHHPYRGIYEMYYEKKNENYKKQQ